MTSFRKFLLAELAVVCIGCALIAAAVVANQQWFDRHFLPAFFVPRAKYVRMEMIARITVAAIGLLLALVLRRPIARNATRVASIALAVALAFGAAELALRRVHLRAAEEVPARSEPRRHLDARLGWLFDPSHVGHQGNVEYAFDRNGYRVRRVDEPVDFERPSIVFTGESMIVGERLAWSDTIPAQSGNLLGLQSANLAVSGFATDQAYLRIAAELPRFRHPVAVVAIFSPAIFDRNLDDDRPHLGAGLQWQPPQPHWRLAALARRVVRYRSDEAIERGIATTRDVLRATIELARQRGAAAVIVVPQFGAEEPRERELRERVLLGLPYVRVALDPRSRVPDDGHPDAHAARAIAVAVANQLTSSTSTHR
jgi:hypothetical protein